MFGDRAAAGRRRRTVCHVRGGRPGADTRHGKIMVACGGWVGMACSSIGSGSPSSVMAGVCPLRWSRWREDASRGPT